MLTPAWAAIARACETAHDESPCYLVLVSTALGSLRTDDPGSGKFPDSVPDPGWGYQGLSEQGIVKPDWEG
jgi:hypothetical protein